MSVTLKNLITTAHVQLTTATTVNIFIDNSVFKIFINKGEKVFSGRVFREPNGIMINLGNPTGTYYELEYGRKTNWMSQKLAMSAPYYRFPTCHKKAICLKTIQKVNEAMRELGYKPNNLARSLQGKSAS